LPQYRTFEITLCHEKQVKKRRRFGHLSRELFQ
jgi:hypothetical protein